MKRLGILTAAVTLLAWTASAQTSASSQTNGSSNTQASATAEKSGVQAQSNSSASASQQAQASREPSEKKGAQASGAASGSASSSTSASADAGPASLNLSNGSTINAELLTTLDARKSKPGDRVVAKTTEDVKQDGKIVLRKGSRLIGHVTQAQAKGEGYAESSLGIVFEQAAALRHSQETPIRVVIQAMAAAQTATSAALDNDEVIGSAGATGTGAVGGSGRAAGGLIGGAGSTVNSTVGATGNAAGNLGQTTSAAAGAAGSTATSAAGNVGGLNAAGHLTSSSRGVIGLQGLNLNSDVSNASQGSVVASATRNVHLASGTQLLLRAVSQ